MASSPSYGERPPLQGIRRSFTAPHRQLTVHERAALDKTDANAEVLYSHPAARIFSFSPPKESVVSDSKVTLPDTDYPVDTVECLPWRSRTETLAATGLMVLEKVRGSVNFLKSGDVMHAILRNSQCWCVDGESKFVLRVRKFQYYRIELPTSTPEEKEKVEELKQVLPKVLRFERTPCPFKRAFHVDLPEDAITPRRKGQWKRRESSQLSTPETETPPLRRTKNVRTYSIGGPTPPPSSYPGGPRRQSEYGFLSNRATSPNRLSPYGGARSITPSSIASSEDASEQPTRDQSSDRQTSEADARFSPDQSPDNLKQAEQLSPKISSESVNRLLPEIEKQSEVIDVVTPDQPKGEAQDLEDQPSLMENELNDSRTTLLSSSEMQQNHYETDIPEITSNGVDIVHTDNDNTAKHLEEPKQQEDTTHATPDPAVVEEVDLPENDQLPALPSLSVESKPTELSSNQWPGKLGEETEPNLNETGEETLQDSIATAESEDDDNVDDAMSTVSADSFYTIETSDPSSPNRRSPPSFDYDQTPLAERIDPMIIGYRQHKRDLSELTVTASTVDEPLDEDTDDPSVKTEQVTPNKPSTPLLDRACASDASWSDVQTPSSSIQSGLRRRLKSHRSLSPLPASDIIFQPPKHDQGHHMTAALLQKACNVALVKPIEVVVLLVHVLVRIAGGATVNDLMSGDLFKRPDQQRRNSRSPDQTGTRQIDDDEDEEDDFGVPIRGRARSADVQEPSPTQNKDTDADSIFDLD